MEKSWNMKNWQKSWNFSYVSDPSPHNPVIDSRNSLLRKTDLPI